MPRPRKKARDLTTEEALAKMFPKRVITRAKKEAADTENKTAKKDSK